VNSLPCVSVLMPVRDAAPWLDEAVASVLDQGFEDFELIAVDDQSSDGSGAKLEAWSRQDRRVRVLRTSVKTGQGIVAALELARGAACGSILLRMDADDLAPPDRFGAQVELLRNAPEVVACGTPVERIPADAVTDRGHAYQEWLNSLTTPAAIHRDLLVECPIAHPTLAVRASAMESVAGYREGPFPEDYDLLLRLVENGGTLGHAPTSPLKWRDHPACLHRTDPRYSLDAFRRLKVKHLLAGPLAGRNPVVMWGAGPTGKAFARLLMQAGRPVATFVDLDPRKIGQTIHGASVVEPHGLGPPGGRLALGAVAGVGPRAEVRKALNALKWAELRDFWVIA